MKYQVLVLVLLASSVGGLLAFSGATGKVNLKTSTGAGHAMDFIYLNDHGQKTVTLAPGQSLDVEADIVRIATSSREPAIAEIHFGAEASVKAY